MENFNVYEGIMDGLKEAVAYKNGDRSRCRVSVRKALIPEYKAEDIIRTRKALNMTQSAFALALGVSSRTVEAWEAGKNLPSGPARHLLFLLEGDHSLADRLTAR